MTHRYLLLSLTTLPAAILLTGCGAGSISLPTPSQPLTDAVITGTVHGGAQSISGAAVRLYAVGLAGNGSPATDIMTGPNGVAPLAYTTTDANGTFTITGNYACPITNPATPVYLTATGGNPGLSPGTTNPYIALVAALGPCNGLLGSQQININEATTAAAAWALAPFAASTTNVGATSTNLTGITTAFIIANQLIDTANSASPNETIASYASVESAKLYTVADILATCVNSSGSDGACSTLLGDTTVGPNTPPDTFSAALNIVQNPATNVGTLYKLVSTTPPFPALSSAPGDWTMSIAYSNDQSATNSPLAGTQISTLDQAGNLWGETGTDVVKFSPQLSLLASGSLVNLDGTNFGATIEGKAAKQSYMTVDTAGNVWLAAYYVLPPDPIPGNYFGSALEYDTNGNMISYANPSSGSIGYSAGYNPVLVAANTDGYIWVGGSGEEFTNFSPVNLGGGVSLLNLSGADQSPASGWNNSQSFQPGAVAFDGLHNAWFTNTVSPQLLIFQTSTANSQVADPATIISIPGVALDLAFDTYNQAWLTYNATIGGSAERENQIAEVSSNGTLLQSSITGSGMFHGSELSIDASNRIWVTNLNLSSAANGYCAPFTFSIFSGGTGGGAPLSAIALGGDTHICMQTIANGLLMNTATFVIDTAGDILIGGLSQSSYNPSTGNLSGTTALIRFVGLATPTKTPNTGPPQAP